MNICLQLAEGLPGRRTIKTHFPFSLLSPDLLSTAKVRIVPGPSVPGPSVHCKGENCPRTFIDNEKKWKLFIFKQEEFLHNILVTCFIDIKD